MAKAIWMVLVFGLAIAGCGGHRGGGQGGEGEGEGEAGCQEMCAHLVEDLLGCEHHDATNVSDCEAECDEHVADRESTPFQVDCAASAGTCVEWQECGDLL